MEEEPTNPTTLEVHHDVFRLEHEYGSGVTLGFRANNVPVLAHHSNHPDISLFLADIRVYDFQELCDECSCLFIAH